MGIDAEMLARRVPRSRVTDKWLKELSWKMGQSLGAGKFFIDREKGYGAITRTNDRYRYDDSPEPGTVYTQDGDDVPAVGDECLLQVHLWGRYYGKGYERGDILFYIAVAEWLEMNIPGCEVWYGGDSSGVCAVPFTQELRKELREHLYSTEGRAYFTSWGQRDEFGLPPACALCPDGKYCGERFGSGRTFASFRCAGCGHSCETHDSGATWTEKKDG